MKTNDLLMMAAAALAAYFIGTKLFPRLAWTTAGGVPVIGNSQQAQQLAGQCDGWAECMDGLK